MGKATGRLTLAFLVSFFACLFLYPSQPPAQQADDSPRGVIVSWRADTHPAEREVASLSAGGVLAHHFRFGPDSLVWLPNSAAQERLRRNPLVTSVVPNRRIFPVESLPGLWPSGPPICKDCGGTDPGSQRVPLGVTRIGAPPRFFTGSGVGVAVVDTGINGQHRDLIRTNGTRVVSPNCFRVAETVQTCDSDIAPFAGGHGTGVAGVIAAVDNTVDLLGVAPKSSLYDVNVFKFDSVACGQPNVACATDATLIQGLEWIRDHHNTVSPPIQVVNVSLSRTGTAGDNLVLKDRFDQLESRDILTVVAAGNEPRSEVTGQVPAGYSSVMAIASTTAVAGFDDGSICSALPHVPADTASWFTTDGRFDSKSRIGVTISAPGEDKEDIVQIPDRCALQAVGLELLSKDGGVTRGAGTSFASPHVAGVAALMKEQARTLGTTLTKLAAQDKIRSTASRRGKVPLNSTHVDYTFDGEREGIVWAPGATQ